MPVFTYIIIILLLIGIIYFFTKRKKVVPPPKSLIKHPDWARNAIIYEVNIRQFTHEGTFKAFEKHLPRLKQMGIKILWLMPVHPIGVMHRLGELGSYYSVKDYKSINPEFGDMDDFKHLVHQIHRLDMKVILDWVPNHTSWDNPLTKKHPEYYYKDASDNFIPPLPEWKDVIRLNYYNPATRKYMMRTMAWWVKETDIDGFRCDVAHMVLKEFWDELYPELLKIKHVFMLAEADIPEQHEKGFDMSYDWKFHHIMNNIAKRKKRISAIIKHFKWVDSVYPGNSYLMQFTSNHDENSWNGTEYERLGEGALTYAVLAATVPGMLLIYSGQESAFKRRLKFFEKDWIEWGNYPLWKFYEKLISLKKRNKALWNGDDGGKILPIATNHKNTVLAYSRKKENNKVVVIVNLSAKELDVKVRTDFLGEEYREIFTGNRKIFAKQEIIRLKPWEYKVYEKELK
jgi:glycosidase